MDERQQPMPPQQKSPEVERERYDALEQLEDWLEGPVIVLGFIWLALLVVELIWGLNPFLNAVVYFIWGIFVLDFLLRLFLAPHKLNYLRKNWLTALSLGVPALRVLRIARFVRLLRLTRAARSLRLVSVVGSINRGMRALRRTLRRRGFGYIAALTLVILFAGAAGMFEFERRAADGTTSLKSYGEALWWTAMILTTLGSDYWPVTPEGRLLNLLLALYAFTVFGYVTATLASFFIGQEAAAGDEPATDSSDDTSPADSGKGAAGGEVTDVLPSARAVQALQREISELRGEVRALREDLRRGKKQV